MELLLNTKQECFLCSKTPESSGATPGLKKTCLKNICRFLQINPSGVLLQALRRAGKKDASILGEDTQYNFTASLCSPCSFVTEKLSGLIGDLEVAQLQVNYYSEVFHRILEEAELTTPTAKTEVDVTLSAEEGMVTHWRKKAKRKCADRINSASSKLPAVKLQRLEPELVPLSVPSKPLLDERNFVVENIKLYKMEDAEDCGRAAVVGQEEDRVPWPTTPVEGETPVVDPLLDDPGLDSPSLEGEDDDPQTDQWEFRSPTQKMIDILAKTHCPLLESGIHSRCTLCGTTITTRTGDTTPIKRHLTSIHVEEVLSFAKRPHISADVFKQICLRVMEKETLQCCRPSVTCKPSRSYVCYLCRKNRTDITRLKIHLVVHHLEVILQNLDHFQSNAEEVVSSSPLELPGGNGSPPTATGTPLASRVSAEGSPALCLGCNKNMFRPLLFRYHMITAHPDQVFLSSKPAHQNPWEFGNSCRKILDEEMERFQDHKASRQCPYCASSRGWGKGTYTCHLVESHREILTGKIKEAVGTSKEESEEEGPPTGAVTDKDKGRFVCVECQANFTRKDSLKRHVLSLHPEQLFLPLKPDQLPLSHFSRWCRQVLEQEAVKQPANRESKSGSFRQCRYCTKEFGIVRNRKGNYLFHLLNSHKRILAGRIKANHILGEEDSPSYPEEVQGEEEVRWPTEEEAGEDFGEEGNMEDPLSEEMDTSVGVEGQDGNERDTKPWPMSGGHISGEPDGSGGSEFQTALQGYHLEQGQGLSTNVKEEHGFVCRKNNYEF